MTDKNTDDHATDTQDNDPITDTSAPADNTVRDADGNNENNAHDEGVDNLPDTENESENTEDSETESTHPSETSDLHTDLRESVNFGDDVDAEDMDSFVSLSEQLGLSVEQAQTAWDTLQQAQLEQEQADAALAKVYDGQLRQMWGNAYDNNYASAQQGIVSAGGDDLRDVLTHAGIINHPVIMQAFATIGQSHLEQGTVSSGGGGMHNPFASDTYNLTEQMRLYRENPSLAAMLEKAATS